MNSSDMITSAYEETAPTGLQSNGESLPRFNFVASTVEFVKKMTQMTFEFGIYSGCYFLFYSIEVVFLWRDYAGAAQKFTEKVFVVWLELIVRFLYGLLYLAHSSLGRNEQLIEYNVIHEKLWHYKSLSLGDMVLPLRFHSGQSIASEFHLPTADNGSPHAIIPPIPLQKLTASPKLLLPAAFVGEKSNSTVGTSNELMKYSPLNAPDEDKFDAELDNHKLNDQPATDAETMGTTPSHRLKHFFKGAYV